MRTLSIIRSEMACWVGLLTLLVYFTVGAGWLDDLSSGAWFAFIFAWLCGAILWAAFGVTKHADCLPIAVKRALLHADPERWRLAYS